LIDVLLIINGYDYNKNGFDNLIFCYLNVIILIRDSLLLVLLLWL